MAANQGAQVLTFSQRPNEWQLRFADDARFFLALAGVLWRLFQPMSSLGRLSRLRNLWWFSDRLHSALFWRDLQAVAHYVSSCTLDLGCSKAPAVIVCALWHSFRSFGESQKILSLIFNPWFSLLDRCWHSEKDTTNHLIVFRRKPNRPPEPR